MIFKILLIIIAAIFFAICLLTLYTYKRGGYVHLVPINGFGLMATRNKIKMYDETSDSFYISNKLTLALGFVFILFEHDEGHPTPGSDDDLNIVADGN